MQDNVGTIDQLRKFLSLRVWVRNAPVDIRISRRWQTLACGGRMVPLAAIKVPQTLDSMAMRMFAIVDLMFQF